MNDVFYILGNSRVLRGGASASRVQVEKTTVTISSDDEDDFVSVSFGIASKGGGRTECIVEVGLDDFQQVLEAMSAVNPRLVASLYASELNRILSAGTESPEKSED
jgi:hypothetical protein